MKPAKFLEGQGSPAKGMIQTLGDLRNSNSGIEDRKCDLLKLFRSIILLTEKELNKTISMEQNGFTKKRLLMVNLISAKARFARFLSLYRWKVQSQLPENTSTVSSKTLQATKYTLSTLKKVSLSLSNYRIPQLNKIYTEINQKVCLLRPLEQKFDPILSILLQITPNSIRHIQRKQRTLIITYDRLTEVRLHIDKDNKIHLSNVSFITRVDHKPALISEIVSMLQKIVHKGIDIFRKMDHVINSLYKIDIFSDFMRKINSIDHRNLFAITFKDAQASITFTEMLSPYNKFNLAATTNKIFALSAIPIYTSIKKCPQDYRLMFNQPELFIFHLLKCSIRSKQISVYHQFLQILPQLEPEFQVKYSKGIHIYAFKHRVASMYIATPSLEWKFIYSPNIFMSRNRELLAVRCGGSYAVSFIRSIAFQSALRQLFTIPFWQSCSQLNFTKRIPNINLSSSPSCPIKVGWSATGPFLYTGKKEFFNLDPIALSAIKEIQKNSPGSVVSYGKLSFEGPWSKAHLSFYKNTGSWKLVLDQANFSCLPITIRGREIGHRFASMIKEIVNIGTRFVSIRGQIEAIPKTMILTAGITELIVRYTQKYVPPFSVKLRGFEEHKGLLEMHRLHSPALSIDFHLFSKLSAHAQNFATTTASFGAFMASSLIPLHVIQRVFLEGPRRNDWSVSVLSDEFSFTLVYKQLFSMNVMWKLSQYFQIILPSTSRSVVLQLALVEFPGFLPAKRLSHPMLRVHAGQLQQFRETIEEFFADRNALLKARFQPKTGNGMGLEQTQKSAWLKLSVSLRPSGFVYHIDHSNRTAEHVDEAFEKLAGDRAQNRRRLYMLSVLGQFPEGLGEGIATAIDVISELPELDVRFLETVSQQGDSKTSLMFRRISFEHGSFSLLVSIGSGDEAQIQVMSELPGSSMVNNARSLSYWVSQFA